MSNTLVIQSHCSPLPYNWIHPCLESVRYWCELNEFDYRFLDDELFNYIPSHLWEKIKQQRVIASDLARLKVLQEALAKDYKTVIWLDADFLIFDCDNFVLPEKESFAVGREVWVQRDRDNKLKVYKKVHNAFLMFRANNSFLPFYIESAERLLEHYDSGVPPQFVGPKLLTALHNIVNFPVMETAGMLSPLVIKDIIHDGGGSALGHFKKNSACSIAGANLCISSYENQDVSSDEMEKLIRILQSEKLLF